MTLQISPVLAGTFDAPDYVAPNNFASTQAQAQTEDAGGVDSRRYTKFDRSATEAGATTDFSFSDFLDMINPLEHIPVVSSIYREITGETINPVSRVVGNIIYGGPMGIASGVLAAAGGAAEATFEQSTGKDSIGNVIAALFGPDEKTAPQTQLADAGNAAPPAAGPASAGTPTLTSAQINARAKLTASAVAAAAASSAQASMPTIGTSSPAAQMTSASASGGGLLDQLAGNPALSLPASSSQTFALDPKKLPYGGVMAPPLQGNNLAVALASSAPGLQMNHTVYTGRTFNSVRPQLTSKPAPAPTPATAPVASVTPPAAPLALPPAPASDAYVSTASPDELPASLMSDIAALRAINTYRNTASQTGASGAGVNVVN